MNIMQNCADSAGCLETGNRKKYPDHEVLLHVKKHTMISTHSSVCFKGTVLYGLLEFFFFVCKKKP